MLNELTLVDIEQNVAPLHDHSLDCQVFSEIFSLANLVVHLSRQLLRNYAIIHFSLFLPDINDQRELIMLDYMHIYVFAYLFELSSSIFQRLSLHVVVRGVGEEFVEGDDVSGNLVHRICQVYWKNETHVVHKTSREKLFVCV